MLKPVLTTFLIVGAIGCLLFIAMDIYWESELITTKRSRIFFKLQDIAFVLCTLALIGVICTAIANYLFL